MLPLHLQSESHIPLYVQLRDQLRALVHSGELRAGDRIPASRELAGQLGVHRTTVANAYAELESEGLIQGHVGRGTYICAIPEKQFSPPPRSNGNGNGHNGPMRWEALFADDRAEESLSRMMPRVPPGAIAFTVARPPDETFPLEEFRHSANAVLRREGRRILQLGSTDGYEPLKRELISLFRGEGLNVKPEQLLITDGCQQAIDLVCKAFLRPGDSVALENPGYPGAIAILAGARVRPLAVGVEPDATRTGHVGLDIDALETVLMQNRVKFILVTPDFHNPTGTALPVARRRALLELAARFQVPVVEDGIYARLRLRGNPIPSLKALDTAGNVIHIDSFSKTAFPGLRVGWCIGPESAIERLRIVKQSTDLAHGSVFAIGDGRIHASRLFHQASREDEKGLSQPPRSDGAGARKAYAGGNVVDAPRRRHEPLADAATGLRCRRVVDSRARARSRLPAGAAFLFAASAAEYAAPRILGRRRKAHREGRRNILRFAEKRAAQARARREKRFDGPRGPRMSAGAKEGQARRCC